jgi:peptidoglycan/xylan/chitin deacetylase (PgdA/CDA1 family)
MSRSARAPILKQRGYPVALFVVADRVGGTNEWDARYGPPPTKLVTWRQVNDLASAGFEIGGHTATHPLLTTVSDADLTREVCDSRLEIERRIGRPVRWFAYPHGDYDERVHRVTASAGYQGALTFGGGLASACDDPFLLNRIPVSEADGVAGFAVKLIAGEDWWTATKRHTPLPLKLALRTLGQAGRTVLGAGRRLRA